MAGEEGSAMTDTRIDDLRTHVNALYKALKIGYADARKPDASRQTREEANRLIEVFRSEMEKVGKELRDSTKATENVQFGVEGLEAEINAFSESVLPNHPALPLPAAETEPVAESSGRVEESGRGKEAEEASRGAIAELSGRGEARRESFSLPPKPPASPRTPVVRKKKGTMAAGTEGGVARAAGWLNEAMRPRTAGAQTSFQSLQSTTVENSANDSTLNKTISPEEAQPASAAPTTEATAACEIAAPETEKSVEPAERGTTSTAETRSKEMEKEPATKTSTQAEISAEKEAPKGGQVASLIGQYHDLMGMTSQPEIEAETERWSQAVAAAAEEAEISTQTIVRKEGSEKSVNAKDTDSDGDERGNRRAGRKRRSRPGAGKTSGAGGTPDQTI